MEYCYAPRTDDEPHLLWIFNLCDCVQTRRPVSWHGSQGPKLLEGNQGSGFSVLKSDGFVSRQVSWTKTVSQNFHRHTVPEYCGYHETVDVEVKQQSDSLDAMPTCSQHSPLLLVHLVAVGSTPDRFSFSFSGSWARYTLSSLMKGFQFIQKVTFIIRAQGLKAVKDQCGFWPILIHSNPSSQLPTCWSSLLFQLPALLISDSSTSHRSNGFT